MDTSRCLAFLAVCLLVPAAAGAQDLTGVLIGTVKDPQGGVLRDAEIRLTSPAIMGGAVRTSTNEKGQLRFPSLPPGLYALGLPFVRRRKSSFLDGVGPDAVELADHLVRHLEALASSRV